MRGGDWLLGFLALFSMIVDCVHNQLTTVYSIVKFDYEFMSSDASRFFHPVQRSTKSYHSILLHVETGTQTLRNERKANNLDAAENNKFTYRKLPQIDFDNLN